MFRSALGMSLLLAAASGVLADDLSLEPCINGDVSASGNFPSQAMEDQIHAYLSWRSDQPYYLFAVAAEMINTPYEESALGTNIPGTPYTVNITNSGCLMRFKEVSDEMRIISCEKLADIEREFPVEISVIRQMLAEIDESCSDESTS